MKIVDKEKRKWRKKEEKKQRDLQYKIKSYENGIDISARKDKKKHKQRF